MEALAPGQQRGVLEAFGFGGHDPEIGLGVVDHRRDHGLEAQEDSELNGDEHDREDDPNDCGDQSNPVMK